MFNRRKISNLEYDVSRLKENLDLEEKYRRELQRDFDMLMKHLKLEIKTTPARRVVKPTETTIT